MEAKQVRRAGGSAAANSVTARILPNRHRTLRSSYLVGGYQSLLELPFLPPAKKYSNSGPPLPLSDPPYHFLTWSQIVSELTKLKGKQSKTGLNWTPPTTLRPPLPLSISDQLLEQLAGRFQKWTPPTTLTPPTNYEQVTVSIVCSWYQLGKI